MSDGDEVNTTIKASSDCCAIAEQTDRQSLLRDQEILHRGGDHCVGPYKQ